jgi:hypothetical protein
MGLSPDCSQQSSTRRPRCPAAKPRINVASARDRIPRAHSERRTKFAQSTGLEKARRICCKAWAATKRHVDGGCQCGGTTEVGAGRGRGSPRQSPTSGRIESTSLSDAKTARKVLGRRAASKNEPISDSDFGHRPHVIAQHWCDQPRRHAYGKDEAAAASLLCDVQKFAQKEDLL